MAALALVAYGIAAGIGAWVLWWLAIKGRDAVASRLALWTFEIAQEAVRQQAQREGSSQLAAGRMDAFNLDRERELLLELKDRIRGLELTLATIQAHQGFTELNSVSRLDVKSASAYVAPLRNVSGTSTSEAAEDLARRFLMHCETAAPEAQAAVEWFRQNGAGAEVIADGISGWGMIRIDRESESVVVPAVRQPMARTPLADYFVLSGYNGVDFLRAAQIAKVARMRRVGETWELESKGLITEA